MLTKDFTSFYQLFIVSLHLAKMQHWIFFVLLLIFPFLLPWFLLADHIVEMA